MSHPRGKRKAELRQHGLLPVGPFLRLKILKRVCVGGRGSFWMEGFQFSLSILTKVDVSGLPEKLRMEPGYFSFLNSLPLSLFTSAG